MTSVTKFIGQFSYNHQKKIDLNFEKLTESVEGIFYHMGFERIHNLWNDSLGWSFIQSAIISNWPSWLSFDQKNSLCNDLNIVYELLRASYRDDIVISANLPIKALKLSGILDALIFRPKGSANGDIIVREIKRSVSPYKKIPKKYLYQLAIYSIGARDFLNQSNQEIIKGEIVSIFPPYIFEVDLQDTIKFFN